MTSRISGDQAGAIQAYSQQRSLQIKQKSADATTAVGPPADRVELSPQGKELAHCLATAKRMIRETEIPKLSPARDARINELAQRVKLGTYRPPLLEIADLLAPALRSLDEETE
jgi:hypothetical protein